MLINEFQCVICGTYDDVEYAHDLTYYGLVCDSCIYDFTECDSCGEMHYSDEMIDTNKGITVCEQCYDEGEWK